MIANFSGGDTSSSRGLILEMAMETPLLLLQFHDREWGSVRERDLKTDGEVETVGLVWVGRD